MKYLVLCSDITDRYIPLRMVVEVNVKGTNTLRLVSHTWNRIVKHYDIILVNRIIEVYFRTVCIKDVILCFETIFSSAVESQLT